MVKKQSQSKGHKLNREITAVSHRSIFPSHNRLDPCILLLRSLKSHLPLPPLQLINVY